MNHSYGLRVWGQIMGSARVRQNEPVVVLVVVMVPVVAVVVVIFTI